MNEKVSIVIPVYNVQDYLPQCLDSVLMQSYANWQAILVDDGSTDNSGRICDAYAEKDSRFQVIHQTNAGAANAKNTGLDHADGAYIAFIDSDDWVEPNWLEHLVDVAREHQADMVEYRLDQVFMSHSRRINDWAESVTVFSAEEYLAQYLTEWTCSLFCTKLFGSHLLKDVRFRRERRCIDDEFFTYKAVSGAGKIARTNAVLYHYRQRASSAVYNRKNRLQKTDDSLEILVERYQWICQRFPALRSTYLKHGVEILFYFAKDFDFTEATVRKFRSIARFYLKESILHYCGRVNLLYALRLQCIPSKDLLQDKEVPEGIPRDDYFK